MNTAEARALLEYVKRRLHAVRVERFEAMQGRVPTPEERGKWLGLGLAEGVVDDLYAYAFDVVRELEETRTHDAE